jgi:anaerobic ribonucleoside-triphosphate reductase activating protein
MLYYTAEQVVWQEVPGEVSLAYTISGCQLGCKGCHSADSWDPKQGRPLSPEHFQQRLQDYQGLISCVLFLGGEWAAPALLKLLTLSKTAGLKRCLYTGLELAELSPSIRSELTFVKTGRWFAGRGGLQSPTTNQRFIDLRTGQCLNSHFQHRN